MIYLSFLAVVLPLLYLFLFKGGNSRHRRSSGSAEIEPALQGGRYSKENPEVVIIGAGVAGSAMAKALADQGRHVTVIERDLREPDRIVGELMQPGGIRALEKLGMEKCVEGIDGQVAHGYSVYKKSSNEWAQLPFPVDPETGKPFKGVSFHHGRFIQRLRESARENPKVNMVEGTVLSLLEEGESVLGVKYKTKDGEVHEVKAPLTVVADGCFSKFRKTLVSMEPKTVSHFVGVVMNDVVLPYEGHGHVFLVDPSPVLSYRIGTNDVRVLVDVPGTVLPENKSAYLLEHTAPQLPEAVRQPFINAVKGGNIKSMPNQKLHPNPYIRRGVLPLGDAYNMRHPLTGGGMTVALSDTVTLVELLKEVPDLADVPLVHEVLADFYNERKPLASTINILAFALYQIFCGGSDDPAVVESVRQACFGYFKLGGSCVEGPMSLLSGLAPSSYFLLYHYVRVALFGAYTVLIPPTPAKLVHAIKVLKAAYGIFAPLMSAERVTPIDLVTRPAEFKPYPSAVAAH